VITGAGRGFCAGQDLSDRAVSAGSAPVDLGASIERNYKPLVLALRALPLPVVCAVNGVAAGAGANLAFACDIVIAARSATFIEAFCKLGLIPDTGGTYFLPRLAGTARAAATAVSMMRARPSPAVCAIARNSPSSPRPISAGTSSVQSVESGRPATSSRRCR